MLKSIFVVALLSFCHTLFAQNGATVSGRILDSETNQPLPFASITIHSTEDNSIISGAISDVEGRFTHVGVIQGQFIVLSSFVGYQTGQGLEHLKAQSR